MKYLKVIGIIFIIILISIIFYFIVNKKEVDEYQNYQKYSYGDITMKSYIAYQDYILADITKENAEGSTQGLFYKINNKDYILVIDDIILCNSDCKGMYNNNYVYFYKDKLYILGNILESYILDGKDSVINNQKFNIPKTNNPLEYIYFNKINKIEDNYIYLDSRIENVDKNINVKCNIDNYNCEIY